MDHLPERLEALEQRTHTVERQLRWWRALACGLVVLAALTWALPAVIAQEEAQERGQKKLAHRVAALEKLLKHFSREGKEIFITGANLHIVNGLDSTDCFAEGGAEIPDCPNGLGNLIVGYNELRAPEFPGHEPNVRTGSHNVVVGQTHNFSSFGGLVVGAHNDIFGTFATVSGGVNNTARGAFAAVSGGQLNAARGNVSTVSGGESNTAEGSSSVVSGGEGNAAIGDFATVTGGLNNIANGKWAAASGGHARTAEGEFDWVAGSLIEDE
jgi:hypothetical protein